MWKLIITLIIFNFLYRPNNFCLCNRILVSQPHEKILPGEIWPKPKSINIQQDYISISQNSVTFLHNKCSSVNSAYLRFFERLYDNRYEYSEPESPSNEIEILQFDHIKINVNYKLCEHYPHQNMSENYSFKICKNKIDINADSNFGIIHAFTSLEQMLWDQNKNLNISEISDEPFIKYRGIHIDSARHFLPMKVIKRQVEIMRINKFNVLHWHITDDESFPYVSKIYPNLTNPWTNPNNPTEKYVYTMAEIEDLIEFSANLGIRVIPEFDTPGHTASWSGVSKDFIAKCNAQRTSGQIRTKRSTISPDADQFYYDENDNENIEVEDEEIYSRDKRKTFSSANQVNKGHYSAPINPTLEKNYQIIQNLFNELRTLFKDQYLHIGGDEVGAECWEHDPQIKKFMKEHHIKEAKDLNKYYIHKLLKLVAKTKFTPIAWEEVWENIFMNPDYKDFYDNEEIKNEVLIEVWKSWTYQRTLPVILGEGYKVILAAPWYIDLIAYGEKTWRRYYAEQLDERLYGCEACLWSEFVDETNYESVLWPSASAVAERCWSNPEEIEADDHVRARIGHFRCYMRGLGYTPRPLFPNGPCWGENEEDDVTEEEIDWDKL